MSEENMIVVVHKGGCHCGAVRFEVKAPEVLTALDCNCSICVKKANLHIIVPEDDFRLISGEDKITTYRFNKKIAQHTFCSICGVQSFYRPRSNPDGYGVNPRCFDDGTLKQLNIRKVDGENWEGSVANDQTILRLSKKL